MAGKLDIPDPIRVNSHEPEVVIRAIMRAPLGSEIITPDWHIMIGTKTVKFPVGLVDGE